MQTILYKELAGNFGLLFILGFIYEAGYSLRIQKERSRQILLLPNHSGWSILRVIWLPVMLIYPVGTVVLGLALCKHLVTAMGGDIGVKSQAEASSEFWFTIPMKKPPRDKSCG